MCKLAARSIFLVALVILTSACGPEASEEPAPATSAPVSPTVTAATATRATAVPTRVNAPASAVISVDTVDQVERLYTLSGHSARVMALAFSGDGVYVASSSLDGTIRLWDVRSGEEVHAFQRGTTEAIVNDIAFSPDGRLLGSANSVWDVGSRQLVYTLERANALPSLFLRTGHCLPWPLPINRSSCGT